MMTVSGQTQALKTLHAEQLEGGAVQRKFNSFLQETFYSKKS